MTLFCIILECSYICIFIHSFKASCRTECDGTFLQSQHLGSRVRRIVTSISHHPTHCREKDIVLKKGDSHKMTVLYCLGFVSGSSQGQNQLKRCFLECIPIGKQHVALFADKNLGCHSILKQR